MSFSVYLVNFQDKLMKWTKTKQRQGSTQEASNI